MPDRPARPVAASPWGAVAPEGADTAGGLAERLGGYCWAEQQLFGLLGGWAPLVAEPDVKLALAEQGDHAAWRAQRWYEVLPTAPPGPDALVTGPDGVAAAIDGLRAAELSTPARLVVSHRVLLPALAAAVRAHLDWSSSVGEAPVGRVLRICLDDLLADWVSGERLLQALGGPSGAVREAESLEQAVLDAGGLIGPGSVGRRPEGWGA